jgi:3-keto-5-aminohexanoate cleavage enzyme
VRGEGDAPPGRPSSEDVASRVAWRAVDRARPPGESGALPLRDSAGIGPDFADHHAPGMPGTEEDAGRSGRKQHSERKSLVSTAPVVICAAVTGSITDRSVTPHVPMSTEEIVLSSVEAWEAGAAVIHLHARDDDGRPSFAKERFAALVDGIRERGCDAVLNLSTGSGGGTFVGADRYECLDLAPEMGSFDCGSTNFNDWVFENGRPFLEDMAAAFARNDVAPEIECFDASHVQNALDLIAAGVLREPLHFQFVLGVRGAAPATLAQVALMCGMLPPGATWGVCGIGRAQLPMNLVALASGGHVRTGLEDNVMYHRGELAVSNRQLVERVARLAGEIGRPVATADEARGILRVRPYAAAAETVRP